MRLLLRIAVGTVLLVLLGLGWIYTRGTEQTGGKTATKPISSQEVADRFERQASFDEGDQILFGDLHVHTTFSVDAFLWSLPLMGGEGVHPPADACDFARYCSQLDFYALTDHAEALNPRTWKESKESVRQCNAVAGPTDDPDLVAFTGFEWTQVGLTPEEHYGHRNVLYKYTDDARLPTRPIAAPGITTKAFSDMNARWQMALIPLLEFPDHKPYLDFVKHVRENQKYRECAKGEDVHSLSPECLEFASTPAELFEKLRQWNFDTLVIPHGTTWGFYTPRGYKWDKALKRENDDQNMNRLVEIYSGHGNAEQYRDYENVIERDGEMVCPEPTDTFTPCCWQAGEIVRERCGDLDVEECERRVEKARSDYLQAGIAAHVTLSGVDVADWQECGQCTDCFEPAFNYRPKGSVQYMLAKGNFDQPDDPHYNVFGFLGSSDNHSARPGTGYKEFARRKMTEARGSSSETWRERLFGPRGEKRAESETLTLEKLAERPPFSLMALERQASFFLTGGLVAVHARNRSREAIWDALYDRNVYGTSGDRILLWFDLIDDDRKDPMGTVRSFDRVPHFRVVAAGAFEQIPGCSDEVKAALGEERLARLCVNECYRPGSRRRAITRIEVVRIRRQKSPDDEVGTLVEDVWKTIPCEPHRDSCTVEFDDPEFMTSDRETLYYVRAIQEPTPAVNAKNLRCENGECKPCFGNYRLDENDDCLSMNEERAWSSPIYLRRQ
ncbi:MAG: DUF3604 domain-containing protein [Polyangiales bacterium]